MQVRIVFMGTPDFAVPTLSAIVGRGHDVVAVYTRAPKAAGRAMALRRTPVHVLADRLSLAVLTPASLHGAAATAQFGAHAADAAVVVAYGLILPKPVLDGPRCGCLNLHASLLPRWRGAAPIQRALMAGDRETGVMVMRMDEGVDTGPVAMTQRLRLTADMTSGAAHDLLAAMGANLMVGALAALGREALTFRPQPAHGVTYAHKIAKAERRIDWRRDAHEVHNQIRGLSPFPGAFFEADLGRGPERVKALRSKHVNDGGAPGAVLDERLTIACASGAVRLCEVQRAGKSPMRADEFLRGARLAPDAVLA